MFARGAVCRIKIFFDWNNKSILEYAPAWVANLLGCISRWSQSGSKHLATASFTVMTKFISIWCYRGSCAMHTHLRMLQKYFMIQRMCSRVMAKNIFNKKSILHSDNGGYRSFDIVVWILLLFYHGYIWESIEILTNASHLTLEKTRRS